MHIQLTIKSVNPGIVKAVEAIKDLSLENNTIKVLFFDLHEADRFLMKLNILLQALDVGVTIEADHYRADCYPCAGKDGWKTTYNKYLHLSQEELLTS